LSLVIGHLLLLVLDQFALLVDLLLPVHAFLVDLSLEFSQVALRQLLRVVRVVGEQQQLLEVVLFSLQRLLYRR